VSPSVRASADRRAAPNRSLANHIIKASGIAPD
jgi:hypothetical protein